MIMTVFYSLIAAIVFIIDIVKFCYKITKIGLSWATLVTVLVIIILSRYFRLRRPSPKIVDAILGSNDNSTKGDNTAEWWPIANRAACLDGLENSRSAIEKCIEQKCKNILLDVDITKCGQLVIFHQRTLKRIDSNISNGTISIQSINYDVLKTINIAKNHPLGETHPPESILHFDELMKLLAVHRSLNVFLFIATSNKEIVKRLTEYLVEDESRLNRIIVCSRSPLLIYQLRKMHPRLVCALWLEKTSKLRLPSPLINSSLFAFAYGILFRNLIACVTGISVVFISKHDFNAHTAQLWRQSGIRPIIYTLNSPSEKRYFQQTVRTQYLTDSLRSEPHHFVKAHK